MTTLVSEDFYGLPAWRFSTPSGASALIVERGATLVSWQPRPGAEVIVGYESREELLAHRGNRSRVMGPWAGSVAGGTYSFGGQRYQLPEEITSDFNLGGWLSEIDFHRVGAEETLTLVGILDPQESYPWQLEVTVTFGLDSGADGEEHLSVTISAENLSAETAPVSLGWHPYVRVPGVEGISNLSLRIPARTRVLSDRRLIPLPGEAAFAGVAGPVRLDYLGTEKLDQSYTSLLPNEDGVVVTELVDPSHGRKVLLTQEPTEAPVVHVYTADVLERGPRSGVALEPCSALSDAFNRADSASRLPLSPGDFRTLTATLTYLG